MTITIQKRADYHTGNGITNEWPYGFQVLREEDLSVILIDAATGITLETVDPGEYTVAGIGVKEGGTVLYPLSGYMTSEYKIGILRTVPYEQNADINNQGGFYPNVIEQALDEQEMQIQQLADVQSRAVMVDAGMTPPSAVQIMLWAQQAQTGAAQSVEAMNASIAAALQSEGFASNASNSADAAEASALEAAANSAASVRWDIVQALSNPQKQQARDNMGLGTMSTATAASYTPTSGLAAVALTGAYSSLTGVPNLALYQLLSAKGQANGYAELGPDGKVPASQAPTLGSYLGNWNASTNTPTVTAGVGTSGDEYTVSVAGTQSVTGVSTSFAVNDKLRFTSNGNKWEKVPGGVGVSSWAGKSGVVTPVAADISDLGTAATTDASDYATAAQGTLATNAVPNTRTVNGLALSSNISITAALVGLGNVNNTSDVNKPISTAQQTALDLKVPTSRTITAGTGMSGGGALSADRTLGLSAGSQASLLLADTAMQPGAFGIGVPGGGAPPVAVDIDDPNTMGSGIWSVGSSTAGTRPSDWTSTNAMVQNFRTGGNWVTQLWMARADSSGGFSGALFSRAYHLTNAAWGPWKRLGNVQINAIDLVTGARILTPLPGDWGFTTNTSGSTGFPEVTGATWTWGANTVGRTHDTFHGANSRRKYWRGYDASNPYPWVEETSGYSITTPEHYGAKGDGVTDDTAAVQACLSVGGTIVLRRNRNYLITATLDAVSNSHILGYGAKLTLGGGSTNWVDVLRLNQTTNVTIEGLEIDGKKADRPTASQQQARGIELIRTQNCRIRDCIVHDCVEHGIHSSAWLAPYTSGGTTGGLVVEDCYVYNNGQTGSDRGMGIWFFGRHDHCFIQNNRVEDNYAGAITTDDVSSSGPTGQGNTFLVVTGNNVSGAQDPSPDNSSCIWWGGSTRGVISNNTCEGYRNAIHIEDSQANEVSGLLTVSGNTLLGYRCGILIRNASDILISGNFISALISPQGGLTDGILIHSYTAAQGNQCARIKISGNVIHSRGRGVAFESDRYTESGDVTDCQITDNEIRHRGAAAVAGHYGIQPARCVNLLVKGNHIHEFYDGIYIQGTSSTSTTCEGNHIHDSVRYGFNLADAGAHLFYNTTRASGTASILFSTNTSATKLYHNRFLENTVAAGSHTSIDKQFNVGIS